MEDVCMKKVYHAMLMSGGILIGDVNNYIPAVLPGSDGWFWSSVWSGGIDSLDSP
jgi:hypothetical protein